MSEKKTAYVVASSCGNVTIYGVYTNKHLAETAKEHHGKDLGSDEEMSVIATELCEDRLSESARNDIRIKWIGFQIKIVMQLKGITEENIISKTGIKRNDYYKYIRGEEEPPLHVLQKICSITDIPMYFFELPNGLK